MFSLKIFQGVLSHLHEYYKQDIEVKCDPNIQTSLSLKKIWAGENLHTTSCNSAKYECLTVLQCYGQGNEICTKLKKFIEPDSS